jgi:predicted transcriptional regulator
MMSRCWKTGDNEIDVIAKLKAAMLELKLIIEADDVNASDVADLRNIIDRLNEAVLLLQLKR